jgi:DNA-directed RNA polymerase specialized sigma24 family protein
MSLNKPNYDSMSDLDLIFAMKDGDRSAFSEVFNRYWKKLYNEAHKRIKRPEVVDEVIQDVFSELWINRATVDTQQIYPYLLMKMANTVLYKYNSGGIISNNDDPKKKRYLN